MVSNLLLTFFGTIADLVGITAGLLEIKRQLSQKEAVSSMKTKRTVEAGKSIHIHQYHQYKAVSRESNENTVWIIAIIAYLLTAILVKRFDLLLFCMTVVSIISLLLFIHHCNRNIEAGVDQTRYVILQSIGFICIFTCLLTANIKYGLKITDFDSAINSLHTVFTISGLLLTSILLYNPFSRNGKAFRKCNLIAYAFLDKKRYVFGCIFCGLLCSGLFFDGMMLLIQYTGTPIA